MARIGIIIIVAVVGVAAWFAWDLAQDSGSGKSSNKDSGPVAPTEPKQQPAVQQPPVEPVRPAHPEVQPVAQETDEEGEPDTLMGSVRDVAGNPLAGVTVQLLDLPFDPERFQNRLGRVRVDRSFKENIIRETTTAEDGTYEFRELTPDKLTYLQVYMRASHPDFVTQWKDAVKVGLIADFRLERGTQVTGTIIDVDTGKPVVGASIKGWYKTPNSVRTVKRMARWQEEVQTDEEGHFRFTGVPPRRVLWMIFHDEYEDFSEHRLITVGQEMNLEFRIKKGIFVKGRVLNKITGKPLAGATIAVRQGIMPRIRERTDENGLFEIKGVERETPSAIEVHKEHFTSLVHPHQFSDKDSWNEKKQNYIELLVEPAGRAAGLVTDPDGVPVTNARIFVARKTPLTFVIRQKAEGLTDQRGSYLVNDLGTTDVFRVVVVAEGRIPSVSEDIQVGPDELREGVNIKMAAGSAIRGQVTSEGGAPVSEATVSLAVPPFTSVWFPPQLAIGTQALRTAVTGPDGRYEFTGLWKGPYTINVTHPEHVTVREEKLRLDDESSNVVKDFDLKIGRYIEGNVISSASEGVEGAEVVAFQPMTDVVAARATVDETGLYRIMGLVEGSYKVQARKGGLTSRAKLNVPTDSSGINFELVPAGRLVGAVVSSKGGPVSNFNLELLSEEQGMERVKATKALGGMSRVIQNEGGMIDIQDIDPGRYTLRITCDTHMSWTKAGLEIAGGDPVDLGSITLDAGASISGVVLTAQGQPVPDAQIQIRNESARQAAMQERQNSDNKGLRTMRRFNWVARTDRRGQYRLGGLPGGNVEISLTANRFAPPPPERFVLAEGSDLRKDFSLVAAGRIVLDLVDDFETPIVSATAQVLNPKRQPVRTANRVPRSDGRGSMPIEGLAPGSYIVRLRRSGMISREVEVEVRSGQETRMRVQMENVKR